MTEPPVLYKTLLADPPWSEAGGGVIKRGADRHYPLMKVPEIVEYLKTIPMAPDAHLYLWATNNHLPDALEVVKALGFRYVTNRAWVKTTLDGSKVANGMGQYFRGGHELLLFATRGKVPFKVQVDGQRSISRISTVLMAPRREHSRKPTQVYDDIELTSYGPFVEAFARNRRDGWDAIGNQVDLFQNENQTILSKE